MKVWPIILTAIVFFYLGYWISCLIKVNKPTAQIECIPDTVIVPGETIVVDNPRPITAYAAKKPGQKLFGSGQKADIKILDSLPSNEQISDCDSIRNYEFEDSLLVIRDSVQGILLRQTIIYKPQKHPIIIQKKDSLIYVNQREFYVGGSAGLNSIRAEIEYLDKKGWSYSAGYDIINRSPTVGIRRRIW
jgi:hypothetical protein